MQCRHLQVRTGAAVAEGHGRHGCNIIKQLNHQPACVHGSFWAAVSLTSRNAPPVWRQWLAQAGLPRQESSSAAPQPPASSGSSLRPTAAVSYKQGLGSCPHRARELTSDLSIHRDVHEHVVPLGAAGAGRERAPEQGSDKRRRLLTRQCFAMPRCLNQHLRPVLPACCRLVCVAGEELAQEMQSMGSQPQRKLLQQCGPANPPALRQRRHDLLLRGPRPPHLGVHPCGQKLLHVLQQ